MARTQVSQTLAVMLAARDLRSRGIDVIDLGPGQPDFPTPDLVKKAGISAIRGDFTRYTPSAGIPELRSAVASHYNQRWKTSFGPENVNVTCGAKHAIFDVAMTVFDEGDEVLIPSPYWVTFPEVTRLAGAEPVFIETVPGDGFLPSIEAIEAAIGPKTRALIVNTPCNPTGAVLPAGLMAELAELGRTRDLFLLVDETYEYFVYEGHQHCSLAAFLNQNDTNFAIVSSVSKTYSMTGWRIGYCLGPAELIDKVNQLQSHQTGNAASISQMAALAALTSGSQAVEAMLQEYARRRRFLIDAAGSFPGWKIQAPMGAFYLFADVSDCIRRLGCEDSAGLARRLLEESAVATVPGSAFGAEGFLRLSYAVTMEQLRSAVDRIQEFLRPLS